MDFAHFQLSDHGKMLVPCSLDVGPQDIPLAALDALRPWQGAQKHRVQDPCAFDFNPWEKLPPLHEELQVTKNK